MDFDPTCNYGDADLTKDCNLVRWKFGALIKNLITLSSTANHQVEIIGIGAICNEIAIDFDNYFTQSYQSYLNNQLLTDEEVQKFKGIDDIFNLHSGEKATDFWDELHLDTNPDWQFIRLKAKEVLKLLGMQNITIEFNREEKYETKGHGKQLTIQRTITRLAKQDID